MAELSRAVGLGLAARGDVRDTVDWVVRAERAGVESVWVHDSYFERDPISFLAPMALATKRIRLGAGALNPYTRHPFVVATTMASLDNLAEGRVSLALGSGLPLRLSQMNIPFEHASERVSESIDQVRTLWRGERLVLNDKVPPLVPMFAPPKRIPIYIAAYTKPYLEVAGEKADGYLARPMKSLAAFQLMRERVLELRAAPRPRGLGHRLPRVPAQLHQRLSSRRSQSGQARALCDLHDLDPLGHLDVTRGVPDGAARRGQPALACRGLPPRR